MKKSKKEKEGEKEENRQYKYFLYAIFFIVIFIVVVLSLRYFIPKETKLSSYSYNGFVFTNMSGLWFTEIQKTGTNKVYNVPLHFGPKELEDITIEGDINNFNNKTQLYITFDPTGNDFSYIALSASEISINLAQTLNITPVAACTVNDTRICSGREIISCKEPGLPAIYLLYDNSTGIYVKNNCIFVQGQGKELVRAADRLLLKWFSVMP
jgi:subtilase family serine protease